MIGKKKKLIELSEESKRELWFHFLESHMFGQSMIQVTWNEANSTLDFKRVSAEDKKYKARLQELTFPIM